MPSTQTRPQLLTKELFQTKKEQKMEILTARQQSYLKYVPQGDASLVDDAPGWSGHNLIAGAVDCDNNSNKIDDKDDNNNNHHTDNNGKNGPICWKCRGTGRIRKKKRAKKRSQKNYKNNDPKKKKVMTENNTTTDTNRSRIMIKEIDRNNSNKNIDVRDIDLDNDDDEYEQCPVCAGKGFLAPKLGSCSDSHHARRDGIITRCRRSPCDWKPAGPLPCGLVSLMEEAVAKSTKDKRTTVIDKLTERQQPPQSSSTSQEFSVLVSSFLENMHGSNNDEKDVKYCYVLKMIAMMYNGQMNEDFIIDKQTLDAIFSLFIHDEKHENKDEDKKDNGYKIIEVNKHNKHNKAFKNSVPQPNNNFPWLPCAGEELCNLVGSWRILQCTKSHRWTTDDLCTAYVAAKTYRQQQQIMNLHTANDKNNKRRIIRYLDLGTGNASVLQMVTWSLLRDINHAQQEEEEHHQQQLNLDNHDCNSNNDRKPNNNNNNNTIIQALGIEARSQAVKLARRSIAFNLGVFYTDDNNDGDGGDGDDGGNSNHRSPIKNMRQEEVQLEEQPEQHEIRIHHGDFRDFCSKQSSCFFSKIKNDSSSNNNLSSGNNDADDNDNDNTFDLITGTPPYFQVDFTTAKTTKKKAELIRKRKNSSNRNNNNNDDYKDSNSNSNDDKDNNNTETMAGNDIKTKTICGSKSGSSTRVQSAIINQGGMPTCKQSAPARCEFRGGIEEYCFVASQKIKPGTGRFIVCENYLNHHRVLVGAHEAELQIVKQYQIVGKERKNNHHHHTSKTKNNGDNSNSDNNGRSNILFCVYVMMKKGNREDGKILLKDNKDNGDSNSNINSSSSKDETEIETITVRDSHGEWTKQYQDTVLEYMSIPVPPSIK